MAVQIPVVDHKGGVAPIGIGADLGGGGTVRDPVQGMVTGTHRQSQSICLRVGTHNRGHIVRHTVSDRAELFVGKIFLHMDILVKLGLPIRYHIRRDLSSAETKKGSPRVERILFDFLTRRRLQNNMTISSDTSTTEISAIG